ncbi:MAG TPA: aminopeptidase [Anaerolineales bacterium]|nr:aminopeptidase [Anaerolineales bacterium]
MSERSFEQNLKDYADVVIKLGANVQPGQRVMIWAWVENADFVRILAESAYQAGASFVEVVWDDEAMRLIRFENAPKDSFDLYSDWRRQVFEEAGERGDVFIRMETPDPTLLLEQDPSLVQVFQKAEGQMKKPYFKLVRTRGVNWVGIAAPTKRWAAKVLPDMPEEERIRTLWELIFKMSRVTTTDDPIAEWERHIANLKTWSAYFNEKKYTALKLTAPGTELYVGLPEKQKWLSAQMVSKYGVPSVVNIPTEEAFTAPHRAKVNGTVRATKPLNVRGMMFIDKFSLTFKDGEVVDVQAEVGQEHLENLLNTDENARFLGEIALVPHSSPISQSGVLFYNTLYDENASCHLALGSAYRFNFENGEELSEEEFAAAGGNSSQIHVDFMIGSENMDVDGVTKDGKVEPVMRGGEFVF